MGASVTQPAGIPRSGSLLPFPASRSIPRNRLHPSSCSRVSLMSFKRVLIPGEISKQVSAMSYVQQIPAQCYTDFKEQQELSHQHQWQRFSCWRSKVPPVTLQKGAAVLSAQHHGTSKKFRLSCLLMQIVSSPSMRSKVPKASRLASGFTFPRDSWHGRGISCTWPSSQGDLWPKGK